MKIDTAWHFDKVTDEVKRIEGAINVASIREVKLLRIEGAGRTEDEVAIAGLFAIAFDRDDELEAAIQDDGGFPDVAITKGDPATTEEAA